MRSLRRSNRFGAEDAQQMRSATAKGPALTPMLARELRHYDAAMAIAEERFPQLLDEAHTDEQRLQVRLRMAYHAVILDGWTDREQRHRMTSTAASIGRDRRPLPGGASLHPHPVVSVR